MFKISELRAFRAVVDAGSVTRAALQLRLTQPTVSRIIAGLERRAGFRLFERAGGRLVLGSDGEAFYQEAERFLSNAQALSDTARDLKEGKLYRVRIVSMPALAYGLLPQALQRIRQGGHKLAVSVEVRRRAEVTRWVAGKQFDLGLASLPVDYPGLAKRRLVSTQACVALPKGHRLARQRSVSAEDLASEPLIGLTADALIQERIGRLFNRLGRSPNFSVSTSSLLAVCHFVSTGIGCGIVDPFTAHAARHMPIAFRILEPRMALHYGLLWDKEIPLSERLLGFSDELVRVAAELKSVPNDGTK
jgi:DNA-binding transcriptional LysR family regulator